MARPDIRIKRMYETVSPQDGQRVLVARVWPRGRTKEQVRAELWLKDAAPSTALRKWFGHEPRRWAQFKDCYFAELDQRGEALDPLRAIAAADTLTLLYAARDPEHNHALALREYLLTHRWASHGRWGRAHAAHR
ncbi:DUF488 family protein [Ectothiorhodospiraceae bacterium 2226]|nr:DUF488 family protein [Ectothiorhodospiraceae bacterium 2226]